MSRHGLKAFLALAVWLLPTAFVQAQAIDPSLPVYQRVDSLKGKITLVGSDTIAQLAAVWGESFQQLYPEVTVEVQVKGSVNAVPSLISGDAQFGLLSRQVSEEEVKAFHEKFGYLPTLLTPSLEPLAVIVHKDNPIESLTLAQVDAIFSQTRKRGAEKAVTTWGDLGLAGQWAQQPVNCQVRNEQTGSQVFFQQVVMGNGAFRSDAHANPSNVELVKAVAANPNAIGFCGSIYTRPEVKAVPIAWKAGEPALATTQAGYPLVRPLQIVVNKAPNKPLPEVEREFIKFILSHRGQQDVIVSGFASVPGRAAQIARDAAGLSSLN